MTGNWFVCTSRRVDCGWKSSGMWAPEKFFNHEKITCSAAAELDLLGGSLGLEKPEINQNQGDSYFSYLFTFLFKMSCLVFSYLEVSKTEKDKDRQITYPLAQQLGLDQAEGRSWKLSLDLPCWWQQFNHKHHPLLPPGVHASRKLEIRSSVMTGTQAPPDWMPASQAACYLLHQTSVSCLHVFRKGSLTQKWWWAQLISASPLPQSQRFPWLFFELWSWLPGSLEQSG